MRLLSDFHDYYDHAFDVGAAAPVLDRRARGRTHRRDDHDQLERAGFRLPPRGTPAEVRARWSGTTHVVVYTDPLAHAGDGKVLAWIDQAPADAYCSAFIGEALDDRAESLRLLLVGDIPFWLRYEARSGWRSNVGEVDVYEVPAPDKGEDLIDKTLSLGAPLVAVDFVAPAANRWSLYAIDLNTAPGLRGTPVEKRLRPSVVHAAIKARHRILEARS